MSVLSRSFCPSTLMVFGQAEVSHDPPPTFEPLWARPSIGQMLMSRRVRFTATATFVLALILCFLSFSNHSDLTIWETLKAGLTRPTTVLPDAECRSSTGKLLTPTSSSIDWSQFAYTQYITNSAYLCNSVMIFETLWRLGSKADRVMMYPKAMMDPAATEATTEDQRLLIKARDVYGAKMVPIQIQRRAGTDATWAESFTKLLAFNQTQYKRVLNVDSDSTILQIMDELFLMPPCPIAMPRAYWLFPKDKILSSQLMLVQPSAIEFDRIVQKTEAAAANDFDMEIVNQLYLDQAMILPHRPYDLLTGEFRGNNHQNYLGTDREKWDPVKIFNEAKFLHFSDWPVPKPWLSMSDSMRAQEQPKCQMQGDQEDCAARDLWNGFYSDFARRRGVREARTPHILSPVLTDFSGGLW